MPKITTEQGNQRELLAPLGYDPAATKVAFAFIQNDPFKHRLFIQQYSRVYSETDIVARATKAVQESVEAITVLNDTTTATEADNGGHTRVDVQTVHGKGDIGWDDLWHDSIHNRLQLVRARAL